MGKVSNVSYPHVLLPPPLYVEFTIIFKNYHYLRTVAWIGNRTISCHGGLATIYIFQSAAPVRSYSENGVRVVHVTDDGRPCPYFGDTRRVRWPSPGPELRVRNRASESERRIRTEFRPELARPFRRICAPAISRLNINVDRIISATTIQ